MRIPMWLPSLVQLVHWLNSAFGVSGEVRAPGSSPLGRWPHHLLDSTCHVLLFLLVSIALRHGSRRTPAAPNRGMVFIAMFCVLRAILEQNDITGQTYALKYETPVGRQRRDLASIIFVPRGDLQLLPNFVGYTISVVLVITVFAGWRQILAEWRAFTAQLLFILMFVFNPAAEMLFLGANGDDPQRFFAMHFAHAFAMVAWNTPLWLWLLGSHPIGVVAKDARSQQ